MLDFRPFICSLCSLDGVGGFIATNIMRDTTHLTKSDLSTVIAVLSIGDELLELCQMSACEWH
jgi:hypothetical protein